MIDPTLRSCSRCAVVGDHRKYFGICNECYYAAYKKDPKAATEMLRRARGVDKVQRYRQRQKLAGKPDRAQTIRVQQQPPPPPKPPPPAQIVATAEVATALSAVESSVLTIDEAAKIEMARRELARRRLIYFIKRRNPKYLAGWVHEDICYRLEKFLIDVVEGRSPRLMLFMPPRHGKSMLCSEEFPAWALGLHPEFQIISTSYGLDLATDFSRKVQGILNSEDYQLLFKTRIHPDISSMELWATLEGGRYCATGIGGPLTGRGAHILVIDDPVKNREVADNPAERKKIKDWYTSTAYSRLMPGGGVLIVQTRWHDDDLSGWLLTQMQSAEKEFAETGQWPIDADRWEVVKYPAIATEEEMFRRKGEALHPARYPLPALLKIKRTAGERDWSALFQQNPVPEEGAYFTKEMIRYYDGAAPHGLATIAACDLAISTLESGHYSAIAIVGVDEKEDAYVLDVLRGRWDSAEIVNQLINVQRVWQPQLIGIERTHVEQAIGPFLETRIREERLWSMAIEPLIPGRRDKQLRARPIQGRMRQGKVLFPRGKACCEWVIPELLRFPGGVHDDGVDALAWIGQMLNMVHYTPPAKPKFESWKDRLNQLTTTAAHLRNPSMGA